MFAQCASLPGEIPGHEFNREKIANIARSFQIAKTLHTTTLFVLKLIRKKSVLKIRSSQRETYLFPHDE